METLNKLFINLANNTKDRHIMIHRQNNDTDRIK